LAFATTLEIVKYGSVFIVHNPLESEKINTLPKEYRVDTTVVTAAIDKQSNVTGACMSVQEKNLAKAK
jgi:hypothetical protein